MYSDSDTVMIIAFMGVAKLIVSGGSDSGGGVQTCAFGSRRRQNRERRRTEQENRERRDRGKAKGEL